MTTITPSLGLGDLILWKMVQLNTSIPISTIIINESIINKYRINNKNYKEYISKFIKNLFPSVNIQYINNSSNHSSPTLSTIKKSYFYNMYTFSNKERVISPIKYIVIHTKIRFDYYINNFYNNDYKIILDYLKNKKFNLPVILMGEKEEIEQNEEVKIHGITSLYNELLVIKNNNTLYDLTRSGLYSDNTIEMLEDDIDIINGAELNICFGYGGMLQICAAFSQNVLCYAGGLQHEILNIYNNTSTIKVFNSLSNFLEKLDDI